VSHAILLTGAPGSGKTTVIRRVLAQLDGPVGVFYTQEIRSQGARQGFEIITLDGRRGTLADVNLRGRERIGRYGVDLAVLDMLGVTAIERAVTAGGVVVIDEIGPMEILSDRFRRATLEAPNSDAQVLGTIVQRGLGFADQVKAMPGVTVLQVRRENQAAMPAQILGLLRGA
jgi:nucleoside-triphosphatase